MTTIIQLVYDYKLYVLLFLALINLFAFCTYWYDKQAAKGRTRRISESTLLSIALAGGSLGATIACRLFRHKTRKQPFAFQLYAILVVQGVIFLGWVSGLIIASIP